MVLIPRRYQVHSCMSILEFIVRKIMLKRRLSG
jgi:hypothetical protein